MKIDGWSAYNLFEKFKFFGMEGEESGLIYFVLFGMYKRIS